MEESTRKRPGDESAGKDNDVKRQRDLEAEQVQGDGFLALLSEVDQETLNEVMKLLDDDWPISPTVGTQVWFVDDPYKPSRVFQTSPPRVFLTSSSWVCQTAPSSYVTINGNEESCGSSFSDLETSFMATFDLCGGGVGIQRECEKCLMAEAEGLEIGMEVMGLGYDDQKILMAERKKDGGGGLRNSACGVNDVGTSGDVEWDDAALARFIGDDYFDL